MTFSDFIRGDNKEAVMMDVMDKAKREQLRTLALADAQESPRSYVTAQDVIALLDRIDELEAAAEVESAEPNKMISPAGWGEFREAGLLWWVNRSLHLFGWAIVVDVGDDGSIDNCYPARCRFRGFDVESEEAGFVKLTQHLSDSMPQLLNDIKD